MREPDQIPISESSLVLDAAGVAGQAAGYVKRLGAYVKAPSLHVTLPLGVLGLTITYLPILNILVPHTGHTP